MKWQNMLNLFRSRDKMQLSVELAEAVLYANDGAAELVKEFKSGTLKLGALGAFPDSSLAYAFWRSFGLFEMSQAVSRHGYYID